MKHLKIIVTGGTGFIGSHLVERLAALKHHVFVIDNLSAGNRPKLPQGVTFYRWDISRPDLVNLFKQIKPHAVYHLAADNRVTSTIEDTLGNNIIGTFNVLNCAKQVKIKQFLFTSSAAVYGESKQLPIKENFPKKPLSAYGISKLTGEQYCQVFAPYFQSTIFRFANVYGPRQSSASEGGVVAIFINKLLNNQPIFVYGNGRQTRDFVFVGDVVDAMILALNAKKTATVNIGSNQSTRISDLIKILGELVGKHPTFIAKPKRSVEIEHSLFSHDAATRELKWLPKTDLISGLVKTIKYFKS